VILLWELVSHNFKNKLAKYIEWKFLLIPLGSLLIAAAHYGGYVFGTDIDYLILHGKSKPTRAKEQKRKPDEKIRSNLEHYNLINRFLDVCVCDASRPVWKPNCRFDAIITDRK
jgi:tRNA (guanine10-N2)-methyltransferase